MEHIYHCSSCNRYTLQQECPRCGAKVVRCRPPKFSPEDRYESLRQEMHKQELRARGLY